MFALHTLQQRHATIVKNFLLFGKINVGIFNFVHVLCSVFEEDRWTLGRNLDWQNVRIFNFVDFLCPVFEEALQ